MKLHNLLALAGVALALTLTPLASAQDQGGGRNRGGGPGGQGGNFDPAQWQQRMMERLKEQLEITDDTEWKALEPLITKVSDARRENMALGFGGMRGGRGGPGGGGPGGGGGRGGMFGDPNPAMEALQKAIDSKADSKELKAAMEKVREARKSAEEQEAILLAGSRTNTASPITPSSMSSSRDKARTSSRSFPRACCCGRTLCRCGGSTTRSRSRRAGSSPPRHSTA
jgi:hypothetical protein